MAEFKQGHALIIGVGTYANSQWSVPITAAEADAVAETLMDPAIGAYPQRQVMTLHNEQATVANVVHGLEMLAERVQPQDTALLFFSGHGAPGEDGQYYFATHEAELISTQRIKAGTGLGQRQLLDLLRAVKAQKLLVIINACFSGNVTATLGTGDVLGTPPPNSVSDSLLAGGAGRVVLTASRANQYSHFRKTQTYTFFGNALIEGLRGKASRPGSGYVGLYELYQHVYQSVRAAASELGQIQEPVLNIVAGVGPFPVARYPGATDSSLGPEAIAQQPPVDTALRVVPAVQQQAGRDAIYNVGGNVNTGGGQINLGAGNRIGNITIGNVAGRDIVTTTITMGGGASGAASLPAQIAVLQQRVAQLSLPEDERSDVVDALGKAKKAGEEGKQARMLDKLRDAHTTLRTLVGSDARAATLADEMGRLISRAEGT